MPTDARDGRLTLLLSWADWRPSTGFRPSRRCSRPRRHDTSAPGSARRRARHPFATRPSRSSTSAAARPPGPRRPAPSTDHAPAPASSRLLRRSTTRRRPSSSRPAHLAATGPTPNAARRCDAFAVVDRAPPTPRPCSSPHAAMGVTTADAGPVSTGTPLRSRKPAVPHPALLARAGETPGGGFKTHETGELKPCPDRDRPGVQARPQDPSPATRSSSSATRPRTAPRAASASPRRPRTPQDRRRQGRRHRHDQHRDRPPHAADRQGRRPRDLLVLRRHRGQTRQRGQRGQVPRHERGRSPGDRGLTGMSTDELRQALRELNGKRRRHLLHPRREVCRANAMLLPRRAPTTWSNSPTASRSSSSTRRTWTGSRSADAEGIRAPGIGALVTEKQTTARLWFVSFTSAQCPVPGA